MSPGSLFIIINTFYLLLSTFTFSALIKFENTKIYLLLAITTKNPKRTLLYRFRLVSSFVYLHISLLLFYILLFTLLILKPCAWQPHGGVGETRQLFCFVGCWKRLERSIAARSLRVRYKPSSHPCGENTRLLHHSALGVPTSWHILCC